MAAPAGNQVTTGGVGDETAPTLPHLDDGVVAEILHRLPTKDAYRCTAVCPRWRAIVSEPTFLCRHLSPRSLPLLDDGPYAIILQPRRKVGYTHLTLVATDPGDRVDLNLPLDPKYTNQPAEAPALPLRKRNSTKWTSEHEAPAPVVLETAEDDYIFSCLLSTGDDCVDVQDNDRPEEPDRVAGDDKAAPAEHDQMVGDGADIDDACDDQPSEEPHQLVCGAADSEDQEAEADASSAEDAPPPPVEVEDYVAFFERTIPKLNISMVASHGRLLLCRSRSRYYVCDPAANRWVVLPPSSFPPTHDMARGIHYNLDAATGRLAFTIVLLVRIPRRRVLVETFSSKTGRWDTNLIGAQGVARCLGVASPGIHADTCFYWLSQRRGRVVRYDVARGRVSVLREPPEAEESNGRVGRSLGTADGRLRDVLVRHPRRQEREHAAARRHRGRARRVGDGRRQGVAARARGGGGRHIGTVFLVAVGPRGAGGLRRRACTGSIIVEKERFLLRYDLESGHKVALMDLYPDDGSLNALYKRFHAFPFFRPS